MESILIADDSTTIRRAATDALQELGFAISVVEDGDSAVSVLEEDQPKLVLADVHMPGCDGYEVARRARAASIPVILLVGTFEAFDTAAFEACGADACVRKPFGAEQLREQVLALVDAPGRPSGAESQEEAAKASDPGSEVPSASEADEVTPEKAAQEGPGDGPDQVETGSEEPVFREILPAALGEPEFDPDPEDFVEEDLAGESDADGAPGSDESMEASTGATAAATSRATDLAIAGASLSAGEIDAIARRVLELGGKEVLTEIAWEVVPDLAEVVVRERLRELEASIEED